jgi:N6-L-threonylcarbamoyladenine synthase
MIVLGIETSCDETAAAVVRDGRQMLSNVVASSLDLHKAYGGVVPEIAARSHLEVINPVIAEALAGAGCSWDDIDAIAVTYGPGLGGSLLVGVLTARTLAIKLNKPLYAVNHVAAHIYANFITETTLPGYSLPEKPPALPLLALIVSGGHSQLVLLTDHSDYQVLGRTADDAVGEAFDKVAKIVGLPYPGGPSIAAAAERGDPQAFTFPKARMQNPYDFSFSGLKTAVLRAAQSQAGKDFTFPSSKLPELLDESQTADIAASFQRIAIETLVSNLEKAYLTYRPTSVVIGGGVAANAELRRQVSNRLATPVSYPDIKLCTDNAAMIAALAFHNRGSQQPADPYSLEIEPSLAM